MLSVQLHYAINQEKRIDKVVFLARDGDIYIKVFRMLYPEIKAEYLYWSRAAGMKVCISDDRMSFLNRSIWYKARQKRYLISDIIRDLELVFLMDDMETELSACEVLTMDNAAKVENIFLKNMDRIQEYYTARYKGTVEYVLQNIKEVNRVLFVDVGWNGSGPLQIRKLIQKHSPNQEVYTVIAANNPSAAGQSEIDILRENMNVYLFSDSANRNHFDTHRASPKNNFFFEMFTQAAEPSFDGIIREGETLLFQFQYPEIENYDTINEIHAGIIQFCRLWKDAFARYPYMMNISGYDAYCPFRLVKRNADYFRRNFGDYILSRSPGLYCDDEVETLREYLN